MQTRIPLAVVGLVSVAIGGCSCDSGTVTVPGSIIAACFGEQPMPLAMTITGTRIVTSTPQAIAVTGELTNPTAGTVTWAAKPDSLTDTLLDEASATGPLGAPDAVGNLPISFSMPIRKGSLSGTLSVSGSISPNPPCTGMGTWTIPPSLQGQWTIP